MASNNYLTVIFSNTTDATPYNINHTDPYDNDFPPFEMPIEMVWVDALQRHYLKVISALGLPGNLAAILTISTIKPRSVATFLVALLAASDSVALVMKLTFNQLYFSLPRVTDAYCRCTYFVYVCSTYANWVLVLIASERLVAVVWPMMRNRFLTKMRVYCICVSLAVPILAIHAPLMVSSFALYQFRCGLGEGVGDYAHGAWQVLNYLFYFMLPVGLLMTITSALCVALSRARRCRQSLMGSSVRAREASREMQRSERAITTLMLVASFLFMLMVLPHCLYYILFRHTKLLEHLQHTSTDQLTRQVTILLADSTHALNFYLYFISVRRFRHRVMALLCCQGRNCPWTRPLPERSSFSRSWSRENGNNNAFQGCCSSVKTSHCPNGGNGTTTTITTTTTFVEPTTSMEMDCL